MTGFICIDKPKDMTSFTAANRTRAILGCKKAGHTGTLDPMATGVLPVALSGATRFIDFLPTAEKSYTARVQLGVTTDTLDCTGCVLETRPVSVTPEQLEAVAQTFLGDTLQIPPMYSALKHDGERLYALARRGESVARAARPIHISALTVSELTADAFTLCVTCSAGTYIRTLAADIGAALGCGAMLLSLRRWAANGFTLADCVTPEALEALRDSQALASVIQPVDRCLGSYPALTVSALQAQRFRNGGALFKNRVGNPAEGLWRVYAPDGAFLGLGEAAAESDSLTVRRLLSDG